MTYHTVFVPGLPVPQGSKTAIAGKNGKRPFLIDANTARLKPWRKHVTSVAQSDPDAPATPLQGALYATIHFRFQRPASHHKTRGGLRKGAPEYPGRNCGDIDKLTRACLDALTDANWWDDDTQVVHLFALKTYEPERHGARITIGPNT